ncbi:MAG: hypothetical protein WBL63_14200 [Candidatus Acidiferrum sp.]
MIRIGLSVLLFVGVLLATAVYLLFHGYFDHGLFEIKQVEWSPSPPRRVAVVAERSDHNAMSSYTYFVLIGDHVFSPTELRMAYHSDDVTFAAAADCFSVNWRDPHHLLVSCRSGTIDSAHIDVRNTRTDDVLITYVNIADSTAKEYSPVRP